MDRLEEDLAAAKEAVELLKNDVEEVSLLLSFLLSLYLSLLSLKIDYMTTPLPITGRLAVTKRWWSS